MRSFFEKLPKLLLVINELNHGTIIDWTPEGYFDDSTMVFGRGFFCHLDLVLKVSSNIGHLSVLIGYICVSDMMGSYRLQLLLM